MNEDKPTGTIDFNGHKIDYYQLGHKIYFDVNHFDALMRDSSGYIPPARNLLKLEARSALNEAKANGKQDFADYVIREFKDLV